MRCVHVKYQLASALTCLLMLLGTGAVAATSPAGAESGRDAGKQQAFVDGIAAVVNQSVITLGQLEAETRSAQAQLRRQNIPVPEHADLQKQVLQRLIMQELEHQEAKRLNIKVTDENVDEALQTIAQRNNFSVSRLRQEIEKSGMDWDTYLKDLRQEIQLDMLRQRAVDSTIIISDAEIDTFLRTEGRQMSLMGGQGIPLDQPPSQPARPTEPRVLELAHILVAVPEGASQGQINELRQKAESLLARVKQGEDFAGVAASSSDGPQALEGGYLGIRPVEGWPDLFIEAARGLAAGQVSGIIQSGNGFHILKVLGTDASGSAAAPVNVMPSTLSTTPPPAVEQNSMLVTQTHARHILIKTSQVMSGEQARHRLEQLLQRLTHGEDFADLAKRYSEDASAPQGGDLGWLTPGETVLPFEQAMDALAPGQISAPVESQFGWHLIQVLERRTKDMEDEFKRMQARQILFQRRVEPALEDWLSQIRGQAYIENRLEPRTNQNRR